MKTNFYVSAVLIISVIAIASFSSFVVFDSSIERWNIPDEDKTMKNPLKKTPENYNSGKEAYSRHCENCHGTTGNGDGKKVKDLIEKSLRPANFKIAEFQNEAEGIHFYKIKFGREGMHSFKGKLTDEDIWAIVLHISTFK